ncbi:hypothetical protein ABKN59_008063 [Abortiporus biennis]
MITRSSARKRQASVDDGENNAIHTDTIQGHPEEKKEPNAAACLPPKKKQKLEMEHQPTRRIRRKGVLKEMLEMPLDILYEILVELSPKDLLSLSRTTKDFRNLLVSKSAIGFWQTAFKNSPDLPPRYPDMNELQFSNLLFSPHCHNCLKPNVHSVIWMFRSRYCTSCKDDMLLKCNRYTNMYNLKITHFESPLNGFAYKFLPIVSETKVSSYTAYNFHGYWVDKKWVDELKDAWKDLKSSDEDKIVRVYKERAQFITIHEQYATLCEDWYNKKKENRADELDKIRVGRFSAILDKLRDLGYGVEIDNCRDQTERFLKREKLVREPKPLTDHVWRGLLEVKAVGIMDEVRAFRLDNEHETAVRNRINLFKQFLFKLRGKVHGDLDFPVPFDFLQIPRIRSIVDAPTEVSLTLEDFKAAVEPILPEVLEEWKTFVDRRLTQSIKSKFKVAKEINPLTLAVGQFFRCNSCHVLRDYPTIRAHTCKDRFLSDSTKDKDDGYKQKSSIELYKVALRKVFSDAPVHLNLEKIESVADVVEKVVAAKGHIASRATLEEVVKDGMLLICKTCQYQHTGIKPIMDWTSLIVHVIWLHCGKFTTRSATDAEVKAIEKLDVRYKEGWTKYLCRHCDKFLTFVDKKKIESHLKERHEISDGFQDHVIKSSDQDMRIEDYPHRQLISHKLEVGDRERDVKRAVSGGYGAVCNFAALTRRSAAKAADTTRRKR